MPLPAEDVELVREFVTDLNAVMPPHVANQLRYRLDTYRNALTVVECRTMDPGQPEADWFDVLVARLQFTRSRGWELYWPDRDSKFPLRGGGLDTGRPGCFSPKLTAIHGHLLQLTPRRLHRCDDRRKRRNSFSFEALLRLRLPELLVLRYSTLPSSAVVSCCLVLLVDPVGDCGTGNRPATAGQ